MVSTVELVRYEVCDDDVFVAIGVLQYELWEDDVVVEVLGCQELSAKGCCGGCCCCCVEVGRRGMK